LTSVNILATKLRKSVPDVLSDLHDENDKYELIMDIYAAHITQSVRHRAAKLGFNVHFIPSGLTDRYQPLDRMVFNAVKATTRREYLKLMRASPMNKIMKVQAVSILQMAWKTTSNATLEAAWSIYEDPLPDRPVHRPGEREDPDEPGAPQTHIVGQIASRYEAVVVEAILALMSEDRPMVSVRKIREYARDQGIGVTDARGFSRYLKKSLPQFVAKKIVKTKAGSVRFTSRGLVSAMTFGSRTAVP
jgi:hypothetical protein